MTKPAPPEFAELYVKTKILDLRTHFKVSADTLRIWANALPPDVIAARAEFIRAMALNSMHAARKASLVTRKVEPVPADFAALAPTMTTNGLEAHYGRSNFLIKRWLSVSGATAKVGKKWTYGNPQSAPVNKPGGLVNEAMRHLMRYCSPVCRAETVAGKAARGLYIVGRRTVDEDSLLAMAAGKGFNPDAWREIRA